MRQVMREKDQAQNPTAALKGQMEEERQAIVQMVEGAVEVEMGERGGTEIKQGENFKKRRDYHRQKVKRSQIMSTEEIPAYQRFQGQAPCLAHFESQHYQLPFRLEGKFQWVELGLGGEDVDLEK